MPVTRKESVALRFSDNPVLPSELTVIDRVRDGRSLKELRDWRRGMLGEGTGFRAVPLLQLVGDGSDRMVVVGRWHFWFADDRLFCDAVVAWTGREGDRWQESPVGEDALAASLAAPFATSHRISEFDAQTVLTVTAKATAEASRDAVADLRLVRLALEARVAASMVSGSDESPSGTLPLLINVGIAVTRARDEARDAVREGLSLWHDDDAAYHGYRRTRDSSLIRDEPPADSTTRGWMKTHDAGVRQCEAMAELLGEESSALVQMVQSAGVMAQIHDAESSDTLNKVASAAAVGIGLPSLGLAYYGADQLFDLDKTGTTIVLGAVLLPTLLAVVAASFVGKGRPTRTVLVAAFLALCLVLCLILPTVVSQTLDLGGSDLDLGDIVEELAPDAGAVE